MDITPYVEGLRRDLIATAESGDAEIKAAAERLTTSLDPSVRLALMEAISQAASEITAEMPAGSVDVRLNGRELDFVLSAPLPPTPPTPPPAPPAPDEADDGSVARVTLRLPESIKNRAEEMATQDGLSLNTWLVNAVRRATADIAIDVDLDLSSLPFGNNAQHRPRRSSRRLNGWL